MNTPKVSVIMPSLNVAPYIRECIDSAINQTLQDIEIICVDAGSTDGTLEILQEFAENDSRIKLIHSDVKSYGHQMNLGMDAATGEYMAILETDDAVKPNMYEVLYQVAQKQNLDFIKSDYEIFIGDGQNRQYIYKSICKHPNLYHCVWNPTRHLEVFNVAMMTWTGLYKMRFLRENNIRCNESAGASYQDNGFWFQTFAWAERVYFLDQAFYMLRRDNPNSSVHSRGKVFCIFEEYAFIEKRLRSDPVKESHFIGIFHKKKYDNCRYHYTRVGDEFKMDFLRRMSDEFQEARTKGELDEHLFINDGFQVLTEIIDHTEQFHIKQMSSKAGWKPQNEHEEIVALRIKLQEKEQELEALKGSLSFRIGSGMTYIPRKLHMILQCIREFGVRFTIRRVLVAFHLLEDERPAQEVDYKALLEKSLAGQSKD